MSSGFSTGKPVKDTASWVTYFNLAQCILDYPPFLQEKILIANQCKIFKTVFLPDKRTTGIEHCGCSDGFVTIDVPSETNLNNLFLSYQFWSTKKKESQVLTETEHSVHNIFQTWNLVYLFFSVIHTYKYCKHCLILW